MKRFLPLVVLLGLSCSGPESPQPVHPVEDEVVLTPTPEFIWHPVSNARSYYIEISPDAGFSQIADTMIFEDTSFLLAETLDLGKRYYWRLQCFNAQGSESAASDAETFQVEKGVGLLTPTASDSTAWPEFSWEPFSGASAYHLLLSRYADLSQPFLDTTLTVTSFEPSDSLPPATYFWQVQATKEGDAVSSPSPTRRLVSYRLADTYFPLYIGRVQQFRFIHQEGTYNILSQDTTILSTTETILNITVTDSFREAGRLYWMLSDTMWDVGVTLSIHHDSVFSPHLFMGDLYPEEGSTFRSWQDLPFEVVHLPSDIILYRKSGTFGATDYDSTTVVRALGLGTTMMVRRTAGRPGDSLCGWTLDSLELN